MKMYFLIRETVPLGFATFAAIKLKSRPEVVAWLTDKSVEKVICGVSDSEFDFAKAISGAIVVFDDVWKGGMEVAIAFPPQESWPAAFESFRRYWPDANEGSDSEAESIPTIPLFPRSAKSLPLIACAEHGAPVAKVRVHPRLHRLVSFSMSKDEPWLWGWGDGDAVRLASLGGGAEYGTGGEAFVMEGDGRDISSGLKYFTGDVAFHPDHDVMAVAREGRSLDVHSILDGALIRSIGDMSKPIRAFYPVNEGIPIIVPPALRGFRSAQFTACGKFIVASETFGEGTRLQPVLRVYDFETARCVRTLAKHELLAIHPSDLTCAIEDAVDTGTIVRLFSVDGPRESDWTKWDCPVIHVSRLQFAPEGDTFAILGGLAWSNDTMSISVYDFPSWSNRSYVEIESNPEVEYTEYPSLRWVAFPCEGFAFHPNGRALVVPSPSGDLVMLDARTGETLNRWAAHDSPITSIDVQHQSGLLVTGGLDGLLKIWRIEQ